LLFFFLFSLSSKPVSCDNVIIVVTTSTSPCPHTGDIPSAPPRHRNYRTNHGCYNCHHVTLCREPSTCWTRPHTRCRHTQATPPPSPSLCLVHLKKASDKSFPLFSPFVFNGAGHFPSTQAHCTPHGMQAPPPHLPSCACWPPLCCHHRHNHHHLNASTTTSATSLTPSLYNRCHPTLPHRQGVQKVRWPPPFPQDHHLLTLPLCVGRSTRVAAPVAPSGLCAHPAPPAILPCMPGGVGGTVHP